MSNLKTNGVSILSWLYYPLYVFIEVPDIIARVLLFHFTLALFTSENVNPISLLSITTNLTPNFRQISLSQTPKVNLRLMYLPS